MNSAQMKRRDALLARNDAALDRWPDRSGPAFTAEMGAVAEGLEALAQAVARSGKDALEGSRTWRFAGNAYFDLGAGRERTPLEKAAAAYRSAESLLEGLDDRVELVKLNYCFGNTLLKLSDAKDLNMASAARERLQTALGLARVHMPAGVASLEKEVANAEQIVSLLTQADGLTQRMDVLKGEIERIDRKNQRAAEAADITELFGVLQQQFEKEKPSLDPTRQTGLSDFMERLKGVVQRGTSENQTLEAMNANRGQLDSMMSELWAQAKKPSLKGAGAAAGSRNANVLAALQELKMFVGAAGMDPATPMSMREESRDLFLRIARLTTAINEAGDDAARMRQLEYDQARGLGNEVRLFSRRPHLMLARPVWPRCSSAVDANRVFFSGSDRVRASLARVCKKIELELVDATPPGADFAADRWQGLRTSSIAVFDLADGAPQVYYELGIALTLGTQLLLLAPDNVDIPFDIAQNINAYPRGSDINELLAQQIDVACYGLQARGGKTSGLRATLAYAERLAAADHANALLGVALKSLRSAGDDPVKFNDALKLFNTYLGRDEHEVLLPRWPGSYPDPATPRWFAVMPFRGEREPAYKVMREAAKHAGIEPVRGDTAEGQEIIESIWQEICRATRVTADLSGFNLNVCLELGIAHTLGRPVLLVGEKGTAQRMAAALPSVAKWRCHTYEADPRARPELQATLQKFFGQAVG
jgi:hypothetical protein